jgi:hypothetical protein
MKKTTLGVRGSVAFLHAAMRLLSHLMGTEKRDWGWGGLETSKYDGDETIDEGREILGQKYRAIG